MESYRSFHSPGNTEASFDSPQETGTNREAGGSTPEAGQQANESVTAPPRNTHTSEDTGASGSFFSSSIILHREAAELRFSS